MPAFLAIMTMLRIPDVDGEGSRLVHQDDRDAIHGDLSTDLPRRARTLNEEMMRDPKTRFTALRANLRMAVMYLPRIIPPVCMKFAQMPGQFARMPGYP